MSANPDSRHLPNAVPDGYASSASGLLLPKHYVEIESEQYKRKELQHSDPNLVAAKYSVLGNFVGTLVVGIVLFIITSTFTLLTAPHHSSEDAINSDYNKKEEAIKNSGIPDKEIKLKIQELEIKRNKTIEELNKITPQTNKPFPEENKLKDNTLPKHIPDGLTDLNLFNLASSPDAERLVLSKIYISAIALINMNRSYESLDISDKLSYRIATINYYLHNIKFIEDNRSLSYIERVAFDVAKINSTSFIIHFLIMLLIVASMLNPITVFIRLTIIHLFNYKRGTYELCL